MILLLAATAAICVPLGIIAVNTWRFTSRQVKLTPPSPSFVDAKLALEHLSKAVQFKTISNEDRSFDANEFKAYRDYLAQTYPLVHAGLRVELVNGQSLLYTWRGSNRAAKRALLLMGHLDVVPVEVGTEKDWVHPPYSGAIADGYVWGRGSWDCKATVMGILEAVETLLRDGHQPERDVYLAFGHDEEVHGLQGALHIADLLKQRNVRFDMVVDEGGSVLDGVLPGVKSRVATIGICEKGFLSVELSVNVEGGHSSRPPIPDAIGLISKAITRLEQTPMQARMTPAVESLFDYIGPEMTGMQKVTMANRWLFDPLVRKQLEKTRLRVMVRTTMVPTIFHAGLKENIVPSQASAIVNCRILTGQTIDDVLAHVKKVIDDDRVKVTPRYGAGGPTLPRLDKDSFATIAKSVRQIFPDAIVAPSLMAGRTDSRHYESISDSVYRFMPIVARADDAKRVHGTNERVGAENYIQAIGFYRQLIINAGALTKR